MHLGYAGNLIKNPSLADFISLNREKVSTFYHKSSFLCGVHNNSTISTKTTKNQNRKLITLEFLLGFRINKNKWHHFPKIACKWFAGKAPNLVNKLQQLLLQSFILNFLSSTAWTHQLLCMKGTINSYKRYMDSILSPLVKSYFENYSVQLLETWRIAFSVMKFD